MNLTGYDLFINVLWRRLTFWPSINRKTSKCKSIELLHISTDVNFSASSTLEEAYYIRIAKWKSKTISRMFTIFWEFLWRKCMKCQMKNHLFQHVLLFDLFQKSTGNHPILLKKKIFFRKSMEMVVSYLLMPKFHLLREVRNFFHTYFKFSTTLNMKEYFFKKGHL